MMTTKTTTYLHEDMSNPEALFIVRQGVAVPVDLTSDLSFRQLARRKLDTLPGSMPTAELPPTIEVASLDGDKLTVTLREPAGLAAGYGARGYLAAEPARTQLGNTFAVWQHYCHAPARVDGYEATTYGDWALIIRGCATDTSDGGNLAALGRYLDLIRASNDGGSLHGINAAGREIDAAERGDTITYQD